MVQLMCKCLNVHINCSGPLHQVPSNIVLTDELRSHAFFSNEFYKIVLNSDGITESIPCLCKSSHVADWVVYTCFNCKTDTHAIQSSKGHQQVLASKKLLSEQESLNSLKESEEFSPAFQMVVFRNTSNVAASNSLLLNPVVKVAVDSMALQLKRFIKDQEIAMEKKIQLFINEEHKRLAIVREKANRDKETLAAMVAREAEHNLELSLRSAADDLADLSVKFGNNKTVNFVSNDTKSIKQTTKLNKPTITQKVDERPYPRRTAAERHFSVPAGDFDAMFDMEGLEGKSGVYDSPYYHSDDDGDTDESSLNDENFFNGSQNESQAVYATSLPISMHGWQRSRHSSEEDELMKVPIPVDPKEMAASIKAMAHSVKCSDGTEMFGDLPHRKMNTADIAMSRISTFQKKK